MNYPIDAKKFLEGCRASYPENQNGILLLETVVPWVNEAYEQGLKDGRYEKTSSRSAR